MDFDAKNIAAPAVRELAPYVPGKPIEELEREYGVRDSIKLASNENPLGPSPKALAALAAAAGDIWLYPDGSGFGLRAALAKRHGVPGEWITLGNGSNDVLVLLAEAFLTPQSEAVCSEYAFAIYAIAARATGATVRIAPAFPTDHPMAFGHDVEAMARLVNERTRLVYIGNPNNPTGTWIEAGALEAFIASLPAHTIVVVDQAYFEYVEDARYPDAADWLARYPNLVVTRTFSKAFGLAGLRVGYAISHPQVADLLNRVRQPFNVNSLAQAAAVAALEDPAHLEHSVAANRAGLVQLAQGFDRLGVRHFPSVANFVLVDCGRPAGAVYEAMLRHGVIVRPLGGYGMPNHLRITVGTTTQNERMLEALQQALAG